MGIRSFTAYAIECDLCGHQFEDDYMPWFRSKDDARDHVIDRDGTVWEDHIWCSDCPALCACDHTLFDHWGVDEACTECECVAFLPALDGEEQ